MATAYSAGISAKRSLGKLRTAISHEDGVVAKIDPFAFYKRFLILGAPTGSFYETVDSRQLEHIDNILRCLELDYEKTIDLAVEVSDAGRAPKNDPAIFVLALASVNDDDRVRAYAYDNFNAIIRIGTHLRQFMAMRYALGGAMSRRLKTAIETWILAKSSQEFAYDVVKYDNRHGWTMADILLTARPTLTEGYGMVAEYALDRKITPVEGEDTILDFFRAVKSMNDPADVDVPDKRGYGYGGFAETIREHRLPREAVPSYLLNSAEIWDALLAHMPLTAMIRNLGKMSAVGLLKGRSHANDLIVSRLGDSDYLRRSRVHPLSLLVALKTYEQGHGDKGSITWKPSKRVVNALDEAFYEAFGNVETTGLRIQACLDLSLSMTWDNIAGMPITPRQASAALALVTVAAEPNAEVLGFSNKMIPVDIRPSMRLDEVIRIIESKKADSTYCDRPVRQAKRKNQEVDAFVIYTDSETSNSVYNVPVWKVVEDYRQATGIESRFLVVATESNAYSIANPNDPLMLDLVGFDTATPAIIGEFLAGRM